MRFHSKLYIGDSIKHPEIVKWKLKAAAGQFNVQLITLSNHPENQLECFHNALLKQKVFRSQKLTVVGIAGDYAEAVLLIQRITEDCIAATNTADIKAFFNSRQ